jgi:diguanylate cyclase (GGDEF)-like protein
MDSQAPNILIVDDTPANVRLLSALLSVHGYQIRKAINGKMALLAIETLLPDLILLDVRMPDMSGYQVCQAIKAHPKANSIPVIFISALGESLDKVRAFEAGAVDYITKPFEASEVLMRVKTHLSLRLAQQEIEALNVVLEDRVRQRTIQLEVANQKLTQLALYDSLTQLPNRTHFMDILRKMLLDECKNWAVFFLDCDRFKIINESLGHGAGDQLIMAVANRLQESLMDGAILARTGGDEFAILSYGIDSLDQAQELAQMLIRSLDRPLVIPGHEIFLGISIGIVWHQGKYREPLDILRDVDTALHRAKDFGRGRSYVFSDSMHQEALTRLQREMDLRRAIEQNELFLVYEPILDLHQQHLVGFEVLLRWKHSTQGLISPGEFIPLAEETGLIIDIGAWVFQNACHQLKQWQMQGCDPSFTLNINLSAYQLWDPGFLNRVDSWLDKSGIRPDCLRLEITETAFIQNDRSMQMLHSLKDRGFQLALDDFGTGYSSLSYLQALPLDMIKIDKSFVQQIGSASSPRSLVTAIVGIAKTLGMGVVAEGIETLEQLQYLQTVSCSLGQGYLFSRSLDAVAASQVLQSSSEHVWQSCFAAA